ncbi:uncharacterized protein [Macaca nemestrina]|uniref:uncharacterized protein isoform X6 n=1 Tax=Macaca nemestrina TaxID=9545 RepID=UPI0039B86390
MAQRARAEGAPLERRLPGTSQAARGLCRGTFSPHGTGPLQLSMQGPGVRLMGNVAKARVPLQPQSTHECAHPQGPTPAM